MKFESVDSPTTNSIKFQVVAVFAVLLSCSITDHVCSQSKTEWLTEKDGKPVFHFRIQVENPDGTEADGCVVTARARDRDIEVVKNEGAIYLTLCPANLENFNNFRILARSADGRQMAHLFHATKSGRSLFPS